MERTGPGRKAGGGGAGRRGYGTGEGDFQRRIYGMLWGSFMKYLTSTAWRTPKKSTIPVLTDLGSHDPKWRKLKGRHLLGAVF